MKGQTRAKLSLTYLPKTNLQVKRPESFYKTRRPCQALLKSYTTRNLNHLPPSDISLVGATKDQN